MIAYTVLLLATMVASMPSLPQFDVPVSHGVSSFPLSRRISPSTGNVAERDRRRAGELYKIGKSRASGQHDKRQDSEHVMSQVLTYTAEVAVGNPPTDYSLIVDTGSSNTWVGASKLYELTSTSKPTGDIVDVMYGSGLFFGVEFKDMVKLTDELVITNQSIGVAVVAKGFNGFDGILGIGPTDLTEHTVLPSNSKVPTVTDNLFNQGTISQKIVGIYFAPSTSDKDGEMTFGGADISKTTGPLTFAPITSTSPSSQFFGIDQTITYGSDGTAVLDSTAGIVDTGTTLTLLASDAFETYKSLTGATEDSDNGLLRISPENYSNLQSLFFNIAGTSFEFTKNAQTWPRAMNSALGGSPDGIYLVIANLGKLGNGGLDFINGMTFLQRFYSVYDSTNNRVGLATTAHTLDTTN